MLHKGNGIPLYMQLQKIIKDDIKNGKYSDGEMIPSEAQFCSRYAITRTTVRKAILNLIDEGFLVSEHGKGTFVKLRKIKYSMWNFAGFSDYLKAKGKVPFSKVLEQGPVMLEGEPFYKLKRARGVMDNETEILTIDTSYIPLNLFPHIERYNFEKESLYAVMRNDYHINPVNVELTVLSVLSTPLSQEHFIVEAGTPLLQVKAIAYDEKGTQIERTNVLYNPSVEFKLLTSIKQSWPCMTK